MTRVTEVGDTALPAFSAIARACSRARRVGRFAAFRARKFERPLTVVTAAGVEPRGMLRTGNDPEPALRVPLENAGPRSDASARAEERRLLAD